MGFNSKLFPILSATLAEGFDHDLLESILNECSAPLRESRMEKAILSLCKERGLSAFQEEGCIWVNAKTKAQVKKARLVFVAHMDHPGVTIESFDGTTAKGSWQGGGPTDIEGAPVWVFNETEELEGEIISATYGDGRPKKIEISLKSEPKNKKGSWGACLQFPTEIRASEIRTRSADDLVSVCACLEALIRAGSPEGVVILLSRSEEIHQAGVVDILKKNPLDPNAQIVVVDTTEGKAKFMGLGVVIRSGDSDIEYTESMTDWLKKKAEESESEARVMRTSGRTDADIFLEKGFEVGSLAISVLNQHNEGASGIMPEIVSTRDYSRLIQFVSVLMRGSS